VVAAYPEKRRREMRCENTSKEVHVGDIVTCGRKAVIWEGSRVNFRSGRPIMLSRSSFARWLSPMNLKDLVDNSESREGRVFAISIQFLIVLSLVTFSIDTLRDLSPQTRTILRIIEIATILCFTIEYFLRIIAADNKLRFIFSFYGIIDLLAFLPFYITTGLDLRSVRILRLLRVITLFKFVRYSKAMQRFQRAFMIAKGEIVLFAIVTFMLLYLSAVGIYYFERQAQPENFDSVFHCLWWAVATLFTVGYGDVYPITVGGKVFTFMVLMIGLGIVAVPSGIVAASLSKVREEEESEE
jgi:voltage-gated potassium channel